MIERLSGCGPGCDSTWRGPQAPARHVGGQASAQGRAKYRCGESLAGRSQATTALNPDVCKPTVANGGRWPSSAVRDWRVQALSITVSSSDNGTNTRGADHFPAARQKTGSQATPQLGRGPLERWVARHSFALMRTTSWSTASAGAPAAGPTLDPV